jgi:hypothetical protein
VKLVSKLLIILGIVFATLPISAKEIYHLGNGWSGAGGGDLIKTKNNPWFLANSGTIKYCLSKGQEFNVGIPRLEQLLEQAFSYWKSEFKANDLNSDFSNAFVGKNRFESVPCAQSHDLRFRFGDIEGLSIPKDFDFRESVAFAIRTDYNEETMKGQGFIYIAPTQGSLKPNSERIYPTAWLEDNNLLLYLTLIHELGHVFGLPDTHFANDLYEGNFVYNLMDISFVENISSEDFIDLYVKELNLVNWNTVPKYFDELNPKNVKFWSLECANWYENEKAVGFEFFDFGARPGRDDCIEFHFLKNEASLLGSRAGSNSKIKIGTMEFQSRIVENNSFAIVKIWFPRKQKVLDIDFDEEITRWVNV